MREAVASPIDYRSVSPETLARSMAVSAAITAVVAIGITVLLVRHWRDYDARPGEIRPWLVLLTIGALLVAIALLVLRIPK